MRAYPPQECSACRRLPFVRRAVRLCWALTAPFLSKTELKMEKHISSTKESMIKGRSGSQLHLEMSRLPCKGEHFSLFLSHNRPSLSLIFSSDVCVILSPSHWARSLQSNCNPKVQTNIYSLCFPFKMNGYFRMLSLQCFPLLKGVDAF